MNFQMPSQLLSLEGEKKDFSHVVLKADRFYQPTESAVSFLPDSHLLMIFLT